MGDLVSRDVRSIKIPDRNNAEKARDALTTGHDELVRFDSTKPESGHNNLVEVTDAVADAPQMSARESKRTSNATVDKKLQLRRNFGKNSSYTPNWATIKV